MADKNGTRDLQAEFEARAHIWRGFESTRHYPCPSAITGNELDDVLAVTVGSKPASEITVFDDEVEGGSGGRPFKLDDIVAFMKSKHVNYCVISDIDACKKLFVYTKKSQLVKYAFNKEVLSHLNPFDSAQIATILNKERAILIELGHDQSAIDDCINRKQIHLLRNAITLNNESDAASHSPLTSQKDNWASRIKQRLANDEDQSQSPPRPGQ